MVARKEPFEVELVNGKKYHWCLCGRSRRQVCVCVRVCVFVTITLLCALGNSLATSPN